MAINLWPLLPIVTLAAVLGLMLIELTISAANERRLRARGAQEPHDPGYGAMRIVYPGTFVAMAAEGLLAGMPRAEIVLVGAVVFGLGKLLKFWAIWSLGPLWTYKVLVVPGETLVTRGPYAWMRHPNYVGVAGELVGVALIAGARITGPLSVAVFGWLLWRRIVIEERALGLRT